MQTDIMKLCGCTRVMNPDAPRMSAKQAAMLANAIADESHEKHMKIIMKGSMSKPTGHMMQCIEVRTKNSSGEYEMILAVAKGIVSNILAVIAPSGREYCIDTDGDSPNRHWSNLAQQALNAAVFPSRKVVVQPIWRVMIQDGDELEPVTMKHDLGLNAERDEFPKELRPGHVFLSEDEATASAEKLKTYLAHPRQETEESKKTKKGR